APACVAAPAGAIGSAADAAVAHRKSNASVNDQPTPRAASRTNSATARSDHDAETSNHALVASLGHVECSRSQRTTRKRARRPLRETRGSPITITAAPIPAAATSARPARTPADAPV